MRLMSIAVVEVFPSGIAWHKIFPTSGPAFCRDPKDYYAGRSLSGWASK